jgi:serine protease Do
MKLMKILLILAFTFSIPGFAVGPVTDFTAVAKKAIPAVVSLKVKGTTKINGGLREQQNLDDFWSQFFNIPEMREREEQVSGQASGFIVSKDGYILTNSHVVDGMKEIKVILNDKREFTGKLVGQDPNTDIALVKIEANDLPFIELGNSDNIEVGQWVVAIGNPYGLQATLTVGVVSAKGRNDLDLTRVEDFIQTDAPINKGNSGGPLLNLDGQVVGINTAIVSGYGSGGYLGIGFAVPSNIAKHDMEEIIANGTVSRGYLGVTLQPLDQDLAQAFGIENVQGALISDVAKDSPAFKAGLKQGDLILKYNNLPVTNIAGLRNAIALMSPGSMLNLSIRRQDKSTADIAIQIGDYPKDSAIAGSGGDYLGLEVQSNSPDKGVVVMNVKPSSIAALAGFKKGLVITSVNQRPVNSADEYMAAVNSTEKGKPVLLLVRQGEFMRYVSLRIDKP